MIEISICENCNRIMLCFLQKTARLCGDCLEKFGLRHEASMLDSEFQRMMLDQLRDDYYTEAEFVSRKSRVWDEIYARIHLEPDRAEHWQFPEFPEELVSSINRYLRISLVKSMIRWSIGMIITPPELKESEREVGRVVSSKPVDSRVWFEEIGNVQAWLSPDQAILWEVVPFWDRPEQIIEILNPAYEFVEAYLAKLGIRRIYTHSDDPFCYDFMQTEKIFDLREYLEARGYRVIGKEVVVKDLRSSSC